MISIHALREEGDRNSYMFTRFLRDFYPRPPRGGRPHDVVFVGECNFISIHALREEGDQDTETGEIYKGDFYPRPPRGGRRDSETNGSKTIKFLSTPSARRATESNRSSRG